MRNVVALPGRDVSDRGAPGQTVAYVRGLVERGDLRPGDRLAPGRELARRIGVSRTSIHAGLRTLAAMGVITTRRGAGAFVTTGPPALATDPLRMLATLHGISGTTLCEARRVVECATAGLAAERANTSQLAAISDEVTGMYATLNEPEAFFAHEVGFHRAVAAGANNPVLGAVCGMVTSLHSEQRGTAIARARGGLRQTAGMHRRIYLAVRRRDVEGARAATDRYLRLGQPPRNPVAFKSHDQPSPRVAPGLRAAPLVLDTRGGL